MRKWSKGTLAQYSWEDRFFTAIIESSGGVLKVWNKTVIWFSNPIPPKETKSMFLRNICTSMFGSTLFTIAKKQKQTQCPSAGEWIKNRGNTQNGVLFINNKYWNPVICDDNMNGTEDYYVKWNKSETWWQVSHDLIHMWNQKLDLVKFEHRMVITRGWGEW